MLSTRAIFSCRNVIFNTNSTKILRSAINTATLQAAAAQQKSTSIAALTSQFHNRRWYASKVDSNDKTITEERIYYGSLASRMKAVKLFSLSTSIAGLAAQPILMEQGMKIGGAGMAVVLCSIGGFFTFVTPFLLHFITKKYVTEVHYNPVTKEYRATTISLFLQRVETKFRPSDVTVPAVPGMFTSFLVGKKSLFVDPSLFDDPEHYVRIMGYDKPIDFKLNLKESPMPAEQPTEKASKQ